MNDIFIMFLTYGTLILFICVFLLICLWAIGVIFSSLPPVSAPYIYRTYILAEYQNTEHGVFCHLGCGDGRMLSYLARMAPQMEYIGVEERLFFFLCAKITAWWHFVQTGKSLRIIYKPLGLYDMSGVSHVLSYIYPNRMDDMLTTFDKTLSKGTVYFSLVYHFTTKQPHKEILLSPEGTRTLFVYEF
ncbi:MAG: hypothetical protein KBB75_01675 [Candidatus Pacebacteria bacterium]|jgi:hypothetical protein|nr:hypothetical protein [Candidatus Paceibacterota bacterium]